jgi:hypothetical protein
VDTDTRLVAAEKRRNVTSRIRKSTMPTMVHYCRDSAVYQIQNLFSSKGVLHLCIPYHMPLQNFVLDVKLIIVDKIHRQCENAKKRRNAAIKMSKD